MRFPIPAAVLIAFTVFSAGAAEVIEIGEHNVSDLPGGKEADGIIGDFVLRNDLVEAVVSGDLPLRRANMSTFYGAGGITPGCLYDLTVRGTDNDELTAFCPLDQRGDVSYVRAIPGEAAVEVVMSEALGSGTFRRHVYSVEDGIPGVIVTSEVVAAAGSTTPVKVKKDRYVRFREYGNIGGIQWMDSNDPAAHCGYAIADLGERFASEVTAGAPMSYRRIITVGSSPGEAWGRAFAQAGEGAVEFSGSVLDPEGKALAEAWIEVRSAAAKTAADGGSDGDLVVPRIYPDPSGQFSVHLPPGDFEAIAHAPGCAPSEAVVPKGGAAANLVVGSQSAIAFSIGMPCKIQIHGTDGTPTPDLGPPERAHGCREQYHTATGDVRIPVAPGSYRVVVTRGIEYSHLEQSVTVESGQTSAVAGVLERVVDTSGWLSTDFHNHSTPSGDNICSTPDRLRNLAAEHIEFAPTTEHNRLFDWAPDIAALGLDDELATVAGMELTGGGAHLNAFPLKPKPHRQDGGAPVWNPDPRINAITLRDFGGREADRWVHVNHPDMVENFIDRDGDGVTDGGFAYLGDMLDAMETENFIGQDILGGAPFELSSPFGPKSRVKMVRPFIWLQLLNQGVRVPAIAVADAHSVHGNGVGGWRTYVKSSTDAPAETDWREMVRNAKAGETILTTGPFLEVSAGAASATAGPGNAIEAPGKSIDLAIRVQCNTWTDIDRVQVLVNGRPVPELNFTRASHPGLFEDPGAAVRFEHRVPVVLDSDALLIVVAKGEGSDLKTGYGSSAQAGLRPLAYHNPIEVDVDGGGFTPNKDTLGFDLPVGGLTPDHVRAVLGAR